MKKTVFLLFIACFACLVSHAQAARIIKFKHEALTYKPTLYYIASVKDDRRDTTGIGSVRAGIFSKKTVSLNLPGGAASALDEFLRAYLIQDTRQTPIDLHITQLEVAEKTGGLKAESELHLSVAFYGAGKKITDYKGTYTMDGSMDATRYIEELIRRGLDNIFKQFDELYQANQEQIGATMKGPSFRIEVEINDHSADPDQLAFSLHRLLDLDDFKGKPDDLSRGAALTSSGVDLVYRSQSQYGQMLIEVTLTPFFDFSRSWCRTGARTVKTLEHEQVHFTITALKACALATAIRNYPFTPDNFKDALENLNRQSKRETEQEQEQFDAESKHGLLPAGEQKWEQSIRDELSKQTCYK